MTRQVIAFVGSARKGGNTDLLVSAVLRGAAEGGAAVEKVYLSELNIAPCDACDACRATGDCIVDDDMAPLYDKLLAADVWVLGTPIYWWGPSALLKAFVDRWYALDPNRRERLVGKRAVLVSPFEDHDPKTARHVVGMLTDTFAYLKIDFVGQVLVTAHARGEVAENEQAMQAARELGRKVVAGA